MSSTISLLWICNKIFIFKLVYIFDCILYSYTYLFNICCTRQKCKYPAEFDIRIYR